MYFSEIKTNYQLQKKRKVFYKMKQNGDLTSALHLISCIPDTKLNLLDNLFLLLLQINRINDHEYEICFHPSIHPLINHTVR